LYQSLELPAPCFAHIPYVAAPGSKEKLSKRKLDKYRKNPQFRKMFERADAVFPRIGLTDTHSLDPVMVEYYEQIGYLPEAILNALARLGWSLDDRTEFLSLAEVAEHFTLDRIVKSPAGFDPDKLVSYQVHWIGQVPAAEKVEGCLPYLVRAGYLADDPDEQTRNRVEQLIAAMGDRLKVFSDILDYEEFFVTDEELEYEQKAVDKRLRKAPESVTLLRKFRQELETVEPFDSEMLDRKLHQFVEREAVKIGVLDSCVARCRDGQVGRRRDGSTRWRCWAGQVVLLASIACWL